MTEQVTPPVESESHEAKEEAKLEAIETKVETVDQKVESTDEADDRLADRLAEKVFDRIKKYVDTLNQVKEDAVAAVESSLPPVEQPPMEQPPAAGTEPPEDTRPQRRHGLFAQPFRRHE